MSTATGWYGTARWQKRRAEQLAKEPFCCYCAKLGKVTAATVADHETPHRGDYESFWHGRLQSLCQPCHDGPKQELEKSGQLRGCDVNGLPIDPNHHWARGEPKAMGRGVKKSGGSSS